MPKNMPTKINPPQKILAKFSFPKISRNRKFPAQKNASIIPVTEIRRTRKPSKHQLFNNFTVLNLPSELNFIWNWKSFFCFLLCRWLFAILCLQTHVFLIDEDKGFHSGLCTGWRTITKRLIFFVICYNRKNRVNKSTTFLVSWPCRTVKDKDMAGYWSTSVSFGRIIRFRVLIFAVKHHFVKVQR